MHRIPVVLLVFLLAGISNAALNAQANVNEEVSPTHEIISLSRDREFSRYITKSTVFTLLDDPTVEVENDLQLSRLLSIDPTSGIVKAAGRLDREQLCKGKNVNPCSKQVDISIRRNESSEMIVGTLTLHIYDVNDVAPSFARPSEAISVSEAARVGDVIATFRAIDSDFGENSVKAFQIYDETETFEVKQSPIDPSEVQIVLQKPLDREQVDEYRFQLRATDGGGLEGVLSVNISVSDDNDNSPEFTQSVYQAELIENRSFKDPFVTVKATDRDDGVNSQLIYKIDDADSIAKQYFYVHHSNGGVSTLLPLDYETNKQFRFKILAVDNLGRGRTSSATVVVNVIDVNDNSPTISVKNIGESYSSNGISGPILSENYEPSENLPKTLAIVIVRDPDTAGGGEVTCRINSTDFSLDPMGSKTYRISPKTAFDREVTAEIPIEISCSDKGNGQLGGPLAATKTVVVKIGDENDNTPTFFAQNESPIVVNMTENNPSGFLIAELVAEDADIGRNGELTYQIQPVSLEKNFEIITKDNRGVLKAKTSFDYEKIHNIEFQINAVDHGKPALTGTATFSINILNVNDNLPSFVRSNYVFFARKGYKRGRVLGKPVLAIDADEEIDDQNISAIRYFLGGDEFVKNTLTIDEKSGQVSVIAPEIMSSMFAAQGNRLAFTILAGDAQNKVAYSRVPASLYIIPTDHSGPVILFPNLDNDTVIMSAPIAAKTPISRVISYDTEDATSEMTFIIESVDPPLADFVIDTKTGIISVTGDLIAIESVLYDVAVLVRNNKGETATAILKIFVSPDQNAVEAFAKTAFVRDGRNLTIVIILCCASGGISLIIITIIVIVKRRDRNSRTYNARKAAEKKLKELGFEAASPPVNDQASLARNISTAPSSDSSALTPTSGHRHLGSESDRNCSPSDRSSDHTCNTTSSLVHCNPQPTTPVAESNHNSLSRHQGVKFQLNQQQVSPGNSSDADGSASTAASGLTGTSSDKQHSNENCPVHSTKSHATTKQPGLSRPHLERQVSNERLRAFFADPHHQEILSARPVQPPQPPPPPSSFLLSGNGTYIERARVIQTNESPNARPRNDIDSGTLPRQVTWAQVSSIDKPSRSNSVSNGSAAYSFTQQNESQIPPGYATLQMEHNHRFQAIEQYPSSTLVVKSANRGGTSGVAIASPSLDSLARARTLAHCPPPQQISFLSQGYPSSSGNLPTAAQRVQLSDDLLRTQNLEMIV